jgi:hypothetical protein
VKLDYEIHASRSPLASALVPHIEFDKALESILESLSDPAGSPLLLCLGVPGFGKTRLIATVKSVVAEAHLEAMRADPNLIPFVGVEAHAPDAGRSFGWREAFLTILAKLEERGVELRNSDVLDPAASLARIGPSRRARSDQQLQADVIEAMQFRGTKVLAIDEIEHIAYQKDVARYDASVDILKTITNETGAQILATGSYEGLAFRNVSGQILRRRRFIHLRRYRAEVPAEFAEYARVVAEMLPLVGYEGDAAPLVPTLYRQSFGAVGMTADLLMQAAFAAQWRGESILHGLARTSRTDADLGEVAKGILESERSVMEAKAHARSDLDALLGLTEAKVPPVTPPAPSKAPTRPHRPGRRKPVRDLVGGGNVR